MQASTQRARRQPAIRILAQEYAESSLQDRGSGEFDPVFVITKLGAKINRALVAGLLESMQPRETANGATMWQGSLRDPSGLHYFSIGDFQSEELQVQAGELSARLEEGEPVLMVMVAKTRLFQSDDGAVYTSFRPEEMCEVDRATYASWLVDAASATMSRVANTERIKGLEVSHETFLQAGLNAEDIESMVLSKNHYGEVDPEIYKLTVMRALDIAEGREQPTAVPRQERFTEPSTPATDSDSSGGDTEKQDVATDVEELRATIQTIIRTADKGEGIDMATIISNCQARGFAQEDVDTSIDELVEAKIITEIRFGWFRITE